MRSDYGAFEDAELGRSGEYPRELEPNRAVQLLELSGGSYVTTIHDEHAQVSKLGGIRLVYWSHNKLNQ